MRGEAFARQLKLLAQLEVRPDGVAPDEAAEELGTRRRTVYRDFRVLEVLASHSRAGLGAPPLVRPRAGAGRPGDPRRLADANLPAHSRRPTKTTSRFETARGPRIGPPPI